MSTVDGTVTEAEVRAALGGMGPEVIPTETVTQAIQEAEIIVASRAHDQASTARVEIAIRAVAAKRAYLSSPPTESLSEMDVSENYDAGSFVEELRRRAEEALELVEAPDGVDRTDIDFEVY